MQVPPENKTQQSKEDLSQLQHHLTPEGSLGLLAYGDLALVAWRKLKQRTVQAKSE